MTKVWIVARHEFSVTVRRLAYRVFVASVPVLGLGALSIVAAVQLLGSGPSGASAAVTAFGYVDHSSDAAGQPLLARFRQQGDIVFTPFPDRGAASAALLAGRIERLFIFPADYLQHGRVVELRETRPGRIGSPQPHPALDAFVLENLAAGRLAPAQLARVLAPYQLALEELTPDGAPAGPRPAPGARLIFVAVSLLFLVSALTAGGYLLQGLAEEKESRILELLVSSLTPEQLMLGKLLGLGAASLLQIAVWACSGLAALLALSVMVGLTVDASYIPSPGRLLVALAYFLLGYALVGTVLAAIGAVTTNQRQAGNITALVMLPVVSPVLAVPLLLNSPSAPLVRVLSFIPFAAPVASLMRLSLGGMGVLEVLASLAVLALSVSLTVWLAARLFRAYLLDYNQAPGPGALLRTLRGR